MILSLSLAVRDRLMWIPTYENHRRIFCCVVSYPYNNILLRRVVSCRIMWIDLNPPQSSNWPARARTLVGWYLHFMPYKEQPVNVNRCAFRETFSRENSKVLCVRADKLVHTASTALQKVNTAIGIPVLCRRLDVQVPFSVASSGPSVIINLPIPTSVWALSSAFIEHALNKCNCCIVLCQLHR